MTEEGIQEQIEMVGDGFEMDDAGAEALEIVKANRLISAGKSRRADAEKRLAKLLVEQGRDRIKVKEASTNETYSMTLNKIEEQFKISVRKDASPEE